MTVDELKGGVSEQSGENGWGCIIFIHACRRPYDPCVSKGGGRRESRGETGAGRASDRTLLGGMAAAVTPRFGAREGRGDSQGEEKGLCRGSEGERALDDGRAGVDLFCT